MTNKTLPTLTTAAAFSGSDIMLVRIAGQTEDQQLQANTLYTNAVVTAGQVSDATTLGRQLVRVASTAAAHNLLEAGTVGLQIFKAATTAAVTDIVGTGGGFTGSAANVPFTPGTLVHVSATNVQTAINQIDAAIERTSALSIGASTVGKGIFVAGTTAAVHDLLEGGAVGVAVYKTATTAAALDQLGGGTAGKGIFAASTTAAAQNLLEAGAAGLTVFKAATTAAVHNLLEGGTVGVQVYKTATTAAAQNALGGTAVGKAVFGAATTAAAQNTLGAGAVGKEVFAAATTAAAQNSLGLNNTMIAGPGITIDGGGTVMATGSYGFVTIPYAGIITNWYMAADASASAVIDVKRSGSSIVGAGNKPTLAGDKFANASAASWTSNVITAGDIIEYNLDSVTSATRINLVMKVIKS
jgi:hypothetical protein